MPTYKEDLDKVKELSRMQRERIKEAGQYEAGAATFRQDVMDKVRENRAQRGFDQLAQDVGISTGKLASQPDLIRQRMVDVNPLDVDVVTSRERAQNLRELATLAQIGEERSGKIEEIVGAGADQLRSAAILKQAEAQSAAEEANALMRIVQQRAAEEAQAFQQRMAEQEFGLAEREFETKLAGGLFSRGGPTSYEEKKLIIMEASKLPESQRAEYILYNGFNPDDSDFSGLFASKGIPLERAASLKALGLANQFTYDPEVGKIVPKSTNKRFWLDWMPGAPFGTRK